jgi:hypothetical protein
MVLKGWSFKSSGAGVDDVAIPVTNPAAGVGWSYTLTSGLLLQSIYEVLTADAVAGSRQSGITITTPAGATQFAIQAGSIQPQSTTHAYTYAAGIVNGSVQGPKNTVQFGNLYLPTGTVISENTPLFDTGDQWSGVIITGQQDTGSSDDLVTLYNGTNAQGIVVGIVDPSEGDGSTVWLGDNGILCENGIYVASQGDISGGCVYAQYTVEPATVSE